MQLFKLILLSFLIAMPMQSFAQGKIADISMDGSYSKARGSVKSTTRRTAGLEIAIPVSPYFQVGLGYSLFREDAHRDGPDADRDAEAILARGLGYPLPDKESSQASDATINGVFRFQIGMVVPFVFGGALWRTLCRENSFYDYGCEGKNMLWNGGGGLSLFLTQRLKARLKLSVSPPITEEKGKFDTNTTFGFSYSL